MTTANVTLVGRLLNSSDSLDFADACHLSLRRRRPDPQRAQRGAGPAARTQVGPQVRSRRRDRRPPAGDGGGRPVGADVVEPAALERRRRARSGAEGATGDVRRRPAVRRGGAGPPGLGRRPEPGPPAGRPGRDGSRRRGLPRDDDHRLRRHRPRRAERRGRRRVARPRDRLRGRDPQPSGQGRGRARPAAACRRHLRPGCRHPRPDRERRHQAAAPAGRRGPSRAVRRRGRRRPHPRYDDRLAAYNERYGLPDGGWTGRVLKRLAGPESMAGRHRLREVLDGLGLPSR